MELKKNIAAQPEALAEAIFAADRVALGRAITLVESRRDDHRRAAERVVQLCLEKIKSEKIDSFRLGISGAPGVGKSSFIEALGSFLIEKGEKLAVLAIDPSSSISRGSILGDKTRMEKLAQNPLAFIRPSPSGAELGGVARRTREAAILCEAAGFRRIFIETVGVGQSETAVRSMVDCFLLLLLPGAGDDLQGIKRGIVEMADLVAVNKADGERERLADEARIFYRNALHLFPKKTSGLEAQVLTCSAATGRGIAEVWQAISDFEKSARASGFFEKNRSEQSLFWFDEAIDSGLREAFFKNENVKKAVEKWKKAAADGSISPFSAAEKALGEIF